MTRDDLNVVVAENDTILSYFMDTRTRVMMIVMIVARHVQGTINHRGTMRSMQIFYGNMP